ncbi:hypothetical protein NEIRO03_2243 [Nematocida sp. AWRm78]|nr:hypothetical protein NEIRO03_2243 [Nematocida sp. AWRm78]
MKGIFNWLNPNFTYRQFLYYIITGNTTHYKSIYEEVEVKRRIIQYFKKAKYITQCRISNRLNNSTNTTESTPEHIIQHTKRHMHIKPINTLEKYTELSIQCIIEDKSYCIPCRRIITDKMRIRHNNSKIHENQKSVYLKMSLQQIKILDKIFYKIFYNNKQYLKYLLKKEIKTVKIEKISITPYKTTKKKTSLNYTCNICNNTFYQENTFIRHFTQKEHKFSLEKFKLKNKKEFTGITEKENIKKRISLYKL